MKSEAESSVFEFQAWLSQSIRRAWILAFAVAVPGAFLLTLWFPHSPQALLGIAFLGIAIGVISDSVERGKKRRADEISEITRAVSRALQKVTALSEPKVEEAVRAVFERVQPEMQLAEIRSWTAEVVTSNRTMVEQVRMVFNLVTTMFERVSADPGRVPRPAETSLPTVEEPLIPIVHQVAGKDYILLYHHGSAVQLIPSSSVYREGESQLLARVPQTGLLDDKLYREIFLQVEHVAREMGIPSEKFWQHLHFIGSSRELFSQSHKESEEAR